MRLVAVAAASSGGGSTLPSPSFPTAFHNCPIAELLVLSPEADRIAPLFGNLFTDEPLPKDGYMDSALLNKPGFGVTLNREGVTLVRPYPRTSPSFAETEAAKDARTPDQAEWLTRGSKIPVGPPVA